MSKFWGLTINVGKKFKQQVQEPFCISGAAVEPLDLANGKYDEKSVQLYLQAGQIDHLLCSLSPKQGVFQVALNVRIGSGETVGFHIKGGSPKSRVHLTGFTLTEGGDASCVVIPFKGQQKSILVTEPKSEDKLKKRVSIKEIEAYGEKEMESSDDDANILAGDLQKSGKVLFNGGQDEDDDDDDDDDDDEDDEDSDSVVDEDELQELQQLVQKGKYNPKTGGKLDLDADEDSDLELLDDEEDDDDDDDDSDEVELNASKSSKKSPEKASKSQETTPKQSSKKDKQAATPKKDKKHDASANSNVTPKTPENQNLKLKTPSSAGHTPMKTFTKGGVLVNDIKLGNGPAAKPGKMVSVYYVGRLKQNNKQFDATQNGPGFRFRLGKGEVIKGWDLGVDGMKVGGKRRLVIPAQLAYGKKGAPPDIPPNSTLTFEVELKNVS